MDPNLFLLPRLRGDSDSGRETGSEDSQSLRDGELHESVQQVKKTLSLYQSQFPMDDPRFHAHLSSLLRSSLSTFQSLLQEALYQPAHQLLLVLEKVMAPLPAQVLPADRCDLYNSLSFVCRKRSKLELAHKYGIKALEITKNFDSSDIDRAGTHLNLCSLLSSQGRFKDAVRHAKLSVEFLQEDLVTMKLTHRTDDLSEKVRHLAVGYQHVAAGLEALGVNREAAVWYGKAVRLASESQDAEIRKMLPTLQAAMTLAKSHGENDTSTSSPSHRYPEVSFSSQDSSKSSSIYLSSKRSPQSGVSSAEFGSENYSAAQALDSGDEDLRTLGSMGALEFEEEEAHRQPILRMSAAKDIKSQSDMRLLLHSGESSPLVRTFLWKRDMSDSERSDFPRHSLNRALARLPRLLKTTDQSLSSSKSPCSSKPSVTRPSHFPKPPSPMRLRRFRTDSNASVASSHSSMRQSLNIITRGAEEWREALVCAVKVGLARRNLRGRQVPSVEIQVEVSAQVRKVEERVAALKIQTAFRRFRAKRRINAVQKWVKNREMRKLVHRVGRKFGEQLGIVSAYESKGGGIEFIAVINAEEYRLSVHTKATSDLQSMISDLEIEGRGKLRLKGPITAQKSPMILADFALLYQRSRYKVRVSRTNLRVSIEVLPDTVAQSAKLSGKTYNAEEFTPIFPQNLPLSLEVDNNNLQLRKVHPAFVLEQKDTGFFFTDLRAYDKEDWVELQMTLRHREVALLVVEKNTEFPEWTEAGFLQVARSIRLDTSGFPVLIKPQPPANEQEPMLTVQCAVRRFLAWKLYLFLKARHRRVPSSKQILKRSITLGKCALVVTATLQSSSAIVFVAVDQTDKKESQLEISPQVWKQYGSTDDSAATALLAELRYSDGELRLRDEKEEKRNREEAAKAIQKWARGVLGRLRVRALLLQREWKMEVCRLQEHGGTRRHAAVFSGSTSLKLELFPTLKFTPQKAKSITLLLSLEEIQGLYQNIPSYLTICDDLQIQGDRLSLQPQLTMKEVKDGPKFIMTTPKKTERGITLVNVYLHEGEFLEFSSDSNPSLSARASLSQLSTHCHVPPSQVFVLSLAAVRYLLEVRKDRLFLSFLSPAPNLSLLIAKNQALVRGVLERQRRNTTVRFCNYGLVACAKRELTGKQYAVYAYFKDSQYKLEAVRKFPRERLKLFLDPSAFRQFGHKINRKKVFEDLVFPKLFVQVKDDCSRLCLDPIFNLLQCDPTGYIRHTVDPKPVSPILRRRLKESGVRVQQTPSEEVSPATVSGRRSARETQSVVSPDSARPKFSTVSEVSVTANTVEESPIPAALETPRKVKTETMKLTESISVQTIEFMEKPYIERPSEFAVSQPSEMPGSKEQTPSIERVSSVAIAPRSVPPLLVVESNAAVPQAVLHLPTDESERIVNRSLVASSEPRSPASQPRSPTSPARGTQFTGAQHASALVSGARYGEDSRDCSRDLVLKVGVDCTAGFFTVSMLVDGAVVAVEAVGEERAEITCPLPSLDPEAIDSYCNSLLASLDVVPSDSGVLLLLNGQSPTGKVLCVSQQLISSRVYTVSISSENQVLCVRAFDEEARRTLELTLGRRTRKMESISQEELRSLIERLKVQVVLGREVLLLDAA